MPDPLLTNLLAFYRNNGTDRSAAHSNLTAVGAPSTGLGIDGSAGSAFSAGEKNGWETDALISTLPFTVSTFLFADAASFESFWPIGQEPTELAEYISLGMVAFGPSKYAQLTIGSGASQVQIVDPDPMTVAWHHLLAEVLADGTMLLFRDSVLVASGVINPTLVFPSPLGDFYVGGYYPGSFSSAVHRAQNVGAWSRALGYGGASVGQPAAAGSDVARLYNGGAGFDPTLATPAAGLVMARVGCRRPAVAAVGL